MTARPTWPSLAPGSPPSSPLRAASGDGLAARLDRGGARRLPQSRSGRRNRAWSNRETAWSSPNRKPLRNAFQ